MGYDLHLVRGGDRQEPGNRFGLGSIKVRFPGGTVVGSAFVGHDLQKEA